MKVCAVIPAAGRGSRLGLDRPKLLAPVTKCDTVWTILRNRFSGLVDHIHVILSPAGFAAFGSALEIGAEGSVPVSVGVQPEPIGMGDAIFRGYPVWSQADILLVVWGDQIHVSANTIRAALQLHNQAQLCIVLPLVSLVEPYVEYCFDRTGRLVAILQRREGDYCQPGGLGDVGTFVLSTARLREAWLQFLDEGCKGARTSKINFLPFLVFLAQKNWWVKQLRVADPLEARGINTTDDLDFFREFYGMQTEEVGRTQEPKQWTT